MKKKTKENRGGARPNSGPKPSGKVRKDVRITPEHEAAIIARYGAKNLSSALDAIAVEILTKILNEIKANHF